MVFELQIVDPNVVEVRWPKAFGQVWTLPYTILADTLLAVDGVDNVDVLRYSALVKVAPHILQCEYVVDAIGNALVDDEQLAHILQTEAGVDELLVKVIPPKAPRN